SGSGVVVQNGPGTLTLTGTNTFTGLVSVVADGTLAVAADNNLGAGAALFIANATLKFLSSFDLDGNRAFTVTDNARIDTNGFNTTVGQSIGDDFVPGSLTKVGAGTLTPSGNNSFSGGIAVNGGTLSVSADNQLGAATGGVSVDGGTLL